MKVDKETLNKIAHLSRLDLDEGKEQEMLESLSEILTWVEKLNELNTNDIDPLTNMSMEVNVMREDLTGKHLDRDRGLLNAPDRDTSFFKVPKVKD